MAEWYKSRLLVAAKNLGMTDCKGFLLSDGLKDGSYIPLFFRLIVNRKHSSNFDPGCFGLISRISSKSRDGY